MVAANRHSVCGQVARWLIHDLRGPAQALTLLSAILDDSLPKDDASIAATLREATARAGQSLELLDRLLIYAPAGAEAGPVSLLHSLRFIAAVCGLHRHPVVLELEGAPAERLPAVHGVAHDVELVLLNLVLNSLQALHGQASGRITMTLGDLGTKVQVAVHDDGPGIARELQGRLFEPFVSGWRRPSAGLGLAASRMLIERFGGSLIHDPTGEPGARFVLELPVVGSDAVTGAA